MLLCWPFCTIYFEYCFHVRIQVEVLTQANISCPVCFGRDACSELMSDVVKGRLKVERAPFSVDPASTEQMAHRVYRNGKVRFWLRPSPPDPVLLQNFEDALCRKGKLLLLLYF